MNLNKRNYLFRSLRKPDGTWSIGRSLLVVWFLALVFKTVLSGWTGYSVTFEDSTILFGLLSFIGFSKSNWNFKNHVFMKNGNSNEDA